VAIQTGENVMRKFLLTTAAVILAAPAFAADMARPAYKAPFAPGLFYDWTGFYIGGQAGWASAHADWIDHLPTLDEAFAVSTRRDGFLGGGHIGAQKQWGSWVLGIEVAYDAGSLRGTTVILEDGFNRVLNSKISDIFTVVGRLGYAVDTWLFYVKGGYASADTHFDKFRQSDGLLQATTSHRESGFVVGGGLEKAWSNWIFGVEASYMAFNVSDALGIEQNGFVTHNFLNIDPTVVTVQGRLSYKFGGPARRY
jgi:outer membrane immunogenic protein